MMYKEGLKAGVRFTTSKGELTIENLLMLTPSQSNVDFLDSIAVKLDLEYENSKGKSFVVKKTTKDKSIKLKLDIVLDILNDMVETIESERTEASKKEDLQDLLAIKAERDKKAKLEMSDEELERRIKELSK